MTFLPIVERELRVTARRRGTYWSRAIVASLAILLGAWIFGAMVERPQSEMGLVIFRGLAGLALAYCLVSGSRATADCLSSEKREGTLGLLFLTDLKGYDVVLGKLAANSVGGFYRLLAIFPVLALPLLMGGVSRGEFWRVVLVLVTTFLFAQAVAILASALSREARAAMTLNTLLLLVPTILLPVCMLFLFRLRPYLLAPGSEPFLWPFFGSPIYSFILGFDFAYRSPPWNIWHFWCSQAVIHSLTWLCLLIACWTVPRTWQDQPVRSTKPSWRERWRYGGWKSRVAVRRGLLNVNAFFWLAARDRRNRISAWILLDMMLAGWVTWYVWYLWITRWEGTVMSWHDAPICITSSIMVSVVFKIWVAMETGERLATERANGAFELLLTTPLTVRDILRGQRLALQRTFLWPWLTAVAIELFLWVVALHFADDQESPVLLIGWPLGLVMFLCDIVALYWVGTYAGLAARNRNQARNMTVLQILLVPWVAFVGVATVISWSTHPTADVPGWKFFLGLWFVVGLAADLGFGLVARRKLLTSFRTLAEQHHSRTATRQAA